MMGVGRTTDGMLYEAVPQTDIFVTADFVCLLWFLSAPSLLLRRSSAQSRAKLLIDQAMSLGTLSS